MTMKEAFQAKGHYVTLSQELIQRLRNRGVFSLREEVTPQSLFEVLETSVKPHAPERVWLTLNLPHRSWCVPSNLTTLVLKKEALKDLDFDA